jgi:hypothetical protein
MKPLGILLLAIGVGLLGYFKGYPWVIAELGIVKKAPVVEVPVVVEAPPPEPEPEPEPMPEPPKPAPPPPPPPPMIVDKGPGEMKPKVDADGFETPIFPSLDELTKNWTVLPAQAFANPRKIQLKKDVTFEVVIGNNRLGSQVRAGGDVYAIASAGGSNIVIAPSPESKARAQVDLNDTNFKETLTAAYEANNALRVVAMKRAFMRQKNKAAEPMVAGKSPSAPINTAKPVKEADGTYKVLLDSISAGDVTEVTPASISKWDDPVQEELDGKTYWTIVVTYTTKTMFGDFTTYAKAHIYNGRVEKWLYRDSGEVVP